MTKNQKFQKIFSENCFLALIHWYGTQSSILSLKNPLWCHFLQTYGEKCNGGDIVQKKTSFAHIFLTNILVNSYIATSQIKFSLTNQIAISNIKWRAGEFIKIIIYYLTLFDTVQTPLGFSYLF